MSYEKSFESLKTTQIMMWVYLYLYTIIGTIQCLHTMNVIDAIEYLYSMNVIGIIEYLYTINVIGTIKCLHSYISIIVRWVKICQDYYYPYHVLSNWWIGYGFLVYLSWAKIRKKIDLWWKYQQPNPLYAHNEHLDFCAWLSSK